jgi:alginate O-acetyltransferase complex protein AlgI
MWLLAFAIYAALKWLTWWQVRAQFSHAGWRTIAYLLAWPGMDSGSFLDPTLRPGRVANRAWFWAVFETALGATFLWVVPRMLPENLSLLRGWAGMLGLILLLHFGSFQILAFFWQSCGVDATPIMSAPLRSTSLSEFWGKRWNLGFRQLSHDLIFRPLHKSLGSGGAGFLVFVLSGLIHDLVISVPARGGYGLPTAYFMLQGAGVAVERSVVGKRIGLRRGIRGWLFMAVTTAAPAFWLFHPPFVRNVILPFMKAIHAL